MAEYAKYSEISPQWKKFVSENPLLGDLDRVGIVERRRIFERVEAAIPLRQLPDDVKRAPVAVQTFTIKARDGYDIPVRTYVPTLGTGTSKSRPVLVYLHAGGFLFGDVESGHLNCQVLASRLNISVLNVGYRLAPQWPFPHGLNDSYDATEWAAANAESHLDASATAGLFVGGISSGANFAGVIAYTARDAGLSPPITGLFLSVPVCIMPDAYPLAPPEVRDQLLSLEQNAINPMLTAKSLNDIQGVYGAPPDDPRVSFLLNNDHSNLPQRVYFQICGGDPLRDEAFMWQKLLEKHSGTRSKIHLYSGLPHGFWRFLSMKASQEWLGDLVEGIRYLTLPNEQVGDSEVVVKGL
ncbi:Alpha/Beta hydrolase protein [Annulohypoxylon moriforme]|nr:Alpha/Beta hydrolase protein [Annulohypoxylon moriforme]